MFERFFTHHERRHVFSGTRLHQVPSDRYYWGLEYSMYTRCRDTINHGIEEFNNATTPDDKIIALNKIRAAIESVELRTPSNRLALANGFHNLKSELFPQIKQAFAENGVNTLLQSDHADSPIARIISDMSPDKADRLMEILHKGASPILQSELSALYPHTDTSLEATQWRAFLAHNTIEFLGGGNSKNFKVTNTIDGSIKVLKVDNRLNMPRHVEQHLRDRLGDVFTSMDTARQVKGIAPDGKTVSRTLLVTDLCSGGSVDEHSDRTRWTGEENTYKSASDIMGQMTQVFLNIQQENCCFPDAKLTNWLVDSTGRVRLADTKSFVFTKEGQFSVGLPGNENTGLLRTNGFIPTELNSGSFNAEKLHASLLGRNLYAYLTGEWPERINLSQPIFYTPLGREYKELIEKLILDPASNRMGLQDAQAKLIELGIKADPVNKYLFRRAAALNASLYPKDINKMIGDLIQSNIKAGISDQAAIIEKINGSLTELEEITSRCKMLTRQISDIKVSGYSLITEASIQKELKTEIRAAVSLNDLKEKLTLFEQTLQQKQSDIKAFHSEYVQIRQELNSLRFGKNDQQMDRYLAQCDIAIAIDLNERSKAAQIANMKATLNELKSPENQEIRSIIRKFDSEKKWNTIGMNQKARNIENAMTNVPIEERRKLLTSNHSSVTNVLTALATHRKSFTKALNDAGMINTGSSAQSFKDCRAKFKEQIDARADVHTEDNKQVGPKN